MIAFLLLLIYKIYLKCKENQIKIISKWIWNMLQPKWELKITYFHATL